MRSLITLIPILALLACSKPVVDLGYYMSFEYGDNPMLSTNMQELSIFSDHSITYTSAQVWYDGGGERLFTSVIGFKFEYEPDVGEIIDNLIKRTKWTLNPSPQEDEIYFAVYTEGAYIELDGNQEISAEITNIGKPYGTCFDLSMRFDIKADNGEGGKTTYTNGVTRFQICAS